MKTLFLVYILFLGSISHPKDVDFTHAVPKCDFYSAYVGKKMFEERFSDFSVFEAYIVPVRVSEETYHDVCFNSYYSSYEMTEYNDTLLMLPRFASRPCDTGTGYCKNK